MTTLPCFCFCCRTQYSVFRIRIPGPFVIDPLRPSLAPRQFPNLPQHCLLRLSPAGQARLPTRHARQRPGHGLPPVPRRSSGVVGDQAGKYASTGRVLHCRLHHRRGGGSHPAQGSPTTPNEWAAASNRMPRRSRQRPRQDGGSLRTADCRLGHPISLKTRSSMLDRCPTGSKTPSSRACFQYPSRTANRTSSRAVLTVDRTMSSSTSIRQTLASCRTRTAPPTTPWFAR